MNLEKLLAANMLRFRTKNLNEGTIDPQLTQVFDKAELAGLEKFLLTQVKSTAVGKVVTYAGTKHYFVCTRIETPESTVAGLKPQFNCTPYYVGSRTYKLPMASVSFPDLIERYVDINYNSTPATAQRELNLYVARAGSTPDLSPTPKVPSATVKRTDAIVSEISRNFNFIGGGGADWAAKQASGPSGAAWATTMTKLKGPQMERELYTANTVVAAVKAGGGAAAAYYNALPTQAPGTVQKTAVPVKKPLEQTSDTKVEPVPAGDPAPTAPPTPTDDLPNPPSNRF